MPIYRGTQRVTPRPGGQSVARVYRGDRLVWQAGPVLPVVQITGTSGFKSRDQFRQVCIDHGTTYQTVQTLPFLLDTSQATVITSMFSGCSSLTHVPDMDTSNVTDTRSMFQNCSSLTHVPDLDTSNVTDVRYMFQGCFALTDGNVRCIGRHPNVSTNYMIAGSGLTRLPFFDANGNPI